MVVGVSVVFDKLGEYLKKNYKDLVNYSMPYCSLYEDVVKGEKYYRANVHFRRQGDVIDRVACVKADSETGEITYFIEGRFWLYAL
ncbi:MAG: hypothetical protein QXN53_07325 [Thermoproteota archaeon]